MVPILPRNAGNDRLAGSSPGTPHAGARTPPAGGGEFHLAHMGQTRNPSVDIGAAPPDEAAKVDRRANLALGQERPYVASATFQALGNLGILQQELGATTFCTDWGIFSMGFFLGFQGPTLLL